MKSRAALVTSLLTGVFLLTGCITDYPLSTAASMRVEVEVYKGPLSKNVSVQWGELEGLVEEAVDALTSFNDTIVAAAAQLGYVTDCTKCNTEVKIDPHYRSKKIAKHSGGKILPRTNRPEIDTRIIKKIGNTPMHGNDSVEKVLWCARDRFQEDKQELMWCHAASKMHDDIRVLLEELHMLHESMMQRSNTVGPLKKPPKEVTDKFNKVYALIITAKDKIDLLKNSCTATCDLNEALFAIRMDLEEAKAILKKYKVMWNDIKDASHALAVTLDNTPVNIKDHPAAEIIPDEAIELAQRISAKVLSSIESVEGIVSQIAAETHLPFFFATHPLTTAEWSRELERAANEMGQLSDFLFKQAHGCQKLERASCEQRKQIMERVGRVASKLKAKAMYWAETHATMAPNPRSVRIAMAAFANLTSEYSNQLESLADGLQWQLGEEGEGVNAKQLPLSLYLRNAETTDFLNLYTWNRAAAPAIWEEMLLHPLNAFTSNETADRIRVIERLMADYNWEKINTVYGSGQGNFSMALIKDEIGNWNLKSFDSDPTELLKAYTNFTLASISNASSLLTPSSRLLELLLPSIGNLPQAEIGGTARLSNVLNTNTLHKRVVEKLRGIKTPAQEQCPVQCPGRGTGANAEVLSQIQGVLDDYEAVIDLLQESLITSNSQRTM